MNNFDQNLFQSNIENLDLSQKNIENLLDNIKLESEKHENFSKINIYILKTIFFEYFFFPGVHLYLENKSQWDYEKVKNSIICTQVNFSGLLMKIVSYLDLNQQFKPALDFLNKHLQFLFENELNLEATLLMYFIVEFGHRNFIEEVNYEYYEELIQKTEKKLNLGTSEIIKLKNLNESKYLLLKNLVDTFDVDSEFKLENLIFLKICLFTVLDNENKNKIKKLPQYKSLSLIFNEPSIYENHKLIEKKISKFVFNPLKKKSDVFNKLKHINKRLKSYERFSCCYMVLKFNASSRGQCFRFLLANKFYIALVPKSKKEKLLKNFTVQRGVYSIQFLKGVIVGVVTEKHVAYRKKYFSKFNEFMPPTFKTVEEILKYNAINPFLCLTFFFNDKTITVVYKNFLELKMMYEEYLIPLKFFFRLKYKKNIVCQSMGKILWRRMRYQMYVLLGRKKVLQSLSLSNRKFTFPKLIVLSKTYLFND